MVMNEAASAPVVSATSSETPTPFGGEGVSVLPDVCSCHRLCVPALPGSPLRDFYRAGADDEITLP